MQMGISGLRVVLMTCLIAQVMEVEVLSLGLDYYQVRSNCLGHLMSTAQVESALVEHPDVSEAAVVSVPHKIKGECLYCFVTPREGKSIQSKTCSELKKLVRERIAPFAMPDYIQVILHTSHSSFCNIKLIQMSRRLPTSPRLALARSCAACYGRLPAGRLTLETFLLWQIQQ